jgi:hypothetical protein
MTTRSESMPTKRTPITRGPRDRYPAEAIAVFAQMQWLESRCDWEIPGDACCAEWVDLQALLHELLHCQPWEWWCVPPQRPPAGVVYRNQWDERARQRYVDLDALAMASS